jgi:hypothetical protein
MRWIVFRVWVFGGLFFLIMKGALDNPPVSLLTMKGANHEGSSRHVPSNHNNVFADTAVWQGLKTTLRHFEVVSVSN